MNNVLNVRKGPFHAINEKIEWENVNGMYVVLRKVRESERENGRKTNENS